MEVGAIHVTLIVLALSCAVQSFESEKSGLSTTTTAPQNHARPFTTLQTKPVSQAINRCEMYKGGPLCERWRGNQTVFVDYRYPQEVVRYYADRLVVGLKQYIDKDQVHPACEIIVQEVVCRYLYPNCTTTTSGEIDRAVLCIGSCNKLLGEHNPCKDSALNYIAAGVLRMPDLFINFLPVHVHLTQFSCQPGQLPTAGPGISCLQLVENIPTSLEPPSVGQQTVKTCGGTANNSYCFFPFTYNGMEYDECTLVNSFESWRPWCATEVDTAGMDGQWGYCDCQGNRSELLQATCELYHAGPVCEPYLNGTEVFIDLKYNQTFLGSLMEHFNKSFFASHQDSRCFFPSLQGLCYLLFPGCHKTLSSPIALPHLLCSGTCIKLRDGACGSDFSRLLQMAINHFQSNKLNPVHFYTAHSICSNRLPREDNFTDSCVNVIIDLPAMRESPTSLPVGSDNIILVSVIVSVICIILVTLSIVVVCVRRRMTVERSGSVIELGGRHRIVWDDDVAQAIRENTIKGKRLQLAQKIGEGNFGRVYKGMLDEDKLVAVKCLKCGPNDGTDQEMANSFIREAMRMKALNHGNVMTLVGICWGTEVYKDSCVHESMGRLPLIVLPYTELGDLRSYLREKRRQAAEAATNDSITTTLLDDAVDEDRKSDSVKPEHVETAVSYEQLLKFGHQIAKGMDYVASQGIVHRDLAARNCMLTWDMQVKVSDFGLARVLEEGKDYYRMGHGCALPVRWMAIESLVDFVFTIESDVWSYGVTLWEIFSFCVLPYAGLPNSDIVSFVQRGSRLEKPNICPDNLYDLMRRCWMTEANDRCKFLDVVATLEEHLSMGRDYLELQPDSAAEHSKGE